jgi:hypothetical protein
MRACAPQTVDTLIEHNEQAREPADARKAATASRLDAMRQTQVPPARSLAC